VLNLALLSEGQGVNFIFQNGFQPLQVHEKPILNLSPFTKIVLNISQKEAFHFLRLIMI
jgi:hypothetical protein